jgi:predicted PhzF superfamily epimerase YddE/YHI9
MGLTIFQVDAFTSRPFAGNPAAVCILPEPGNAKWMQQVATEMNLSETAFLYKQGNAFNLRWFTPASEVELCGHATLASAHILWETGQLAADEQACFSTLSGLLTARRGAESWIEMDFPAKREEQVDVPPVLLEALGVSAKYVGKNVFDYLVEVETEGRTPLSGGVRKD